MKTQLISKLVSAALLLSATAAFGQRSVMVQSNTGSLLYPTNLWSANAASIRSGISLPAHATNTVIQVTNGGTGASNSAVARTNLGLVWGGLTNTNPADFRTALGLSLAVLTNTNNASFLTALGLGVTNSPLLAGLTLTNETGLTLTNGSNSLVISASAEATRTNLGLSWSGLTNASASGFRSALGLSWSALTNTNASNFQTALFGSGVFPVLADASGTVVTPTNFVFAGASNAPVLQDFTTNASLTATNTLTNARILVAYSLSTNVSGATHTCLLPASSVQSGDFATIVHTGPTNSSTIVRVSGSTNILVSMSNFYETTQFIYRNGSWGAFLGLSYQGPIYFSGTNATVNAATSRTNLGLPLAALTNTNTANFRADIGLPLAALTNTNTANFRADIGLPLAALTNTNTANFRADLGLPLAALTNTSNEEFVSAVGALSTNGNASGLTNFPGITTNVSVIGVNNTNTLVFVNGLLTEVQ